MNGRRAALIERAAQFAHSIRFRLVIWFMLILGVVMVALSGFIYYRQVQDLRSVAMARLSFTLERVLGNSHEREGLAEQPPAALSTIAAGSLTPLNDPQDSEILALQATDGTILQSAGTLTSPQIQALKLPQNGWSGAQEVRIPQADGAAAGRYLFISPAILQNGQVSAYLLVGVPLDANNQLGRLLITLILGNLVTMAIAVTGAFWLADRAMRPVRTITQAARQISETDLHQRLNLKGRDELAELGNTFDGMLDRLQAAFERQRRFTADASHELRTPLTIIDLESSRGLAARRSVDEYERILGTIQSENQSMIRLVTNLLSLARMDAGQLRLAQEPVDLSEAASEVIERLQPLARSQGVELQVGELPETLVRGDRVTLVLMLTNLVENAIKYSSPVRHPKVSIIVGTQEEDGRQMARLQVQDNGIGISPEHLEHIFDRFYQAEPSRHHAGGVDGDGSGQDSSGMGLGLAIAQWIAKAHGGEIRVESKIGTGSTFEVTLPENHPDR